ncbi:MAG: hypothetical protein R3E10_03720 [Gemmatimonadota bacterium]
MVFRASRAAPAGPFLVARAALFVLGAGLALVGMMLPSRVLVWIAIAVLLVAFLLRFVGRAAPTQAPEAEEE